MNNAKLKKMKIAHFTVFPEACLELSPQLNIIAGENGCGKTHLLKLAYSIIAVSHSLAKKSNGDLPTKSALSKILAEKLTGVFRPDALGRLATRKRGRERCAIRAQYHDADLNLAFDFSSNSKSEVNILKTPRQYAPKSPVYLPTRELLSIYPGFVSLYAGRYLEFEETWNDTCILLGESLTRGPREQSIKSLLLPLEESMGGVISLEKNGRFYLKIPGQGNMEIHLVAEGLRKLGMIARLIATGALLDQGYLFWDEPETNLNPKLIKECAKTILNICNSGIQVFIATHSLFLMREIDILLHDPQFASTSTRFFGIQSSENGYFVNQGNSVDDIGPIDSLDEELSQSERYLTVEATA